MCWTAAGTLHSRFCALDGLELLLHCCTSSSKDKEIKSVTHTPASLQAAALVHEALAQLLYATLHLAALILILLNHLLLVKQRALQVTQLRTGVHTARKQVNSSTQHLHSNVVPALDRVCQFQDSLQHPARLWHIQQFYHIC